MAVAVEHRTKQRAGSPTPYDVVLFVFSELYNPAHGEVYSIQPYVIKIVSDTNECPSPVCHTSETFRVMTITLVRQPRNSTKIIKKEKKDYMSLPC
jgi:hypothetical protein